jgi:pyruvate/2-oxoglutarate dehydrogenase complex dihydrolipoamide acyltransferase (E2) component
MTPILAPDPGLGPGETLTLSCWLVSSGEVVLAGDRVVELLMPEATFDVAAPVTGIVRGKRVDVDEPVRPGMILGFIEPEESP